MQRTPDLDYGEDNAFGQMELSMGRMPILVENKVTVRQGADSNEKLVMKTCIKQGTKVQQRKKPRLDEQGRNINQSGLRIDTEMN